MDVDLGAKIQTKNIGNTYWENGKKSAQDCIVNHHTDEVKCGYIRCPETNKGIDKLDRH